VAVDARFAVLDTRGIGRYTRSVAPILLGMPGVTCTFVAPGWGAPRRRIAAALGVEMRDVVARVPSDAAVVWNPSNGTDLRTGAPNVTTVHDVVPFAYPAARSRVREREQAPLLRTAAGARRIIADSAFGAGEITARLNVERERIVVVELGVGAPFSALGARHVLPGGRPYVLHVGAHDPRKNVDTLIAAWQRAFPAGEPALAFTHPPAALPPGAVVAEARDDDRLAEWYRGALFVAVPSLDEGFGLPVLEAFACGVPALVSRAAALPEPGGEVAVYVDEPRNVEAWSDALRSLAVDDARRERLRDAGIERAALFSWQRCAQRTLDVLREAAGA
jgi:glycosyltransferase involved in cell wall biosynthesis